MVEDNGGEMSFDDIMLDDGDFAQSTDGGTQMYDTVGENESTHSADYEAEDELDSSSDRSSSDGQNYELHETNVLHDIVAHSRANQVMNEEPTAMMLFIYFTGWLPDPNDYTGAFISGGSGQGKSHMKEKVVDPLFDNMPDDTLYDPVGGSEQGVLNDPRWDDCRVGALNEMNKLSEEQIEFFKTVYDPKGFSYVRSKRDGDAEGGFTSDEIHRDPKPFVMMIADENALEIDPELLNRLVEIRIDESPELSRQVGKLMWGHDTVEMSNSPHVYNQSFDEGTEALKEHIANMPTMPVHIPADEEEYGWDAWKVIEPIFNFYQGDSKRVIGTLASLAKASAVLNYHARERITIDGEEHLLLAPQDVGNLLCARRTILSSTHNLNAKKFAVIDAFEEIGGHTQKSGSKRQLEFEQIRDYLEDRKDLPQIPKKQLQKMLEEMNERYIISIEDHPQDANKNIFVYSGGSVFGSPNLGEYPELFEGMEDPIHGGTLAETMERIEADLGASDSEDIMKSDPSEFMGSGDDGGSESNPQASLTGASTGTRVGKDELSASAQAVLEPLRNTMDGMYVSSDEMKDLKIEHMCGAAPTTVSVQGDRTFVKVTGEPTMESREGTVFDPSHDQWDDLSWGGVKAEIEDAISELKGEKFMEIEATDDGAYYVEVK